MNRKIYKQLLSWRISPGRMPLILYGARQTGKTFILQEFGRKEFNRTHYLNFEEDKGDLVRIFEGDLSSRQIISLIELFLETSIDQANDLLILDEIQECPRALTALKYFCETMPQLAVCCAGSYLGLALSADSFPVGKVDILHLYPLSFQEFLEEENPALAQYARQPFGEKIDEFVHTKLCDTLKTYYITGGMPRVVNQYMQLRDDPIRAYTAARAAQKALVTGYISDLSKHAGKENAQHIRRVFENIPVQLCREIDGAARKYQFKGVIPGKNRYADFAGPVDWLVNSGLALKTHIVDTPRLPLMAFTKENSFKLYLFDVGILGCMLDLPFQAVVAGDYGLYKGFFAENYVAQELVCGGCPALYCWMRNNAEIEFLVVIDGAVVPVEVKSGNRTMAKSLKAYADRYDPPMKYKIGAVPYARYPTLTNMALYHAGRIIEE